jgi:O-antigen ligase
MTQIATLVFVVGIVGLFMLDRDHKARTSNALWLPVLWLLLAGSRQVSIWLQMQPANLEDQYLEGSPLDRAIYTLLLAAGIIVLVGRRRSVARLLRDNWPILLFVLYCAVSVSWSDYPQVAFKRWIKSLGDYVMILIVLTDHNRPSAVKQVLAKAGFLLLPLSVLVIKYYPDIGRSYGRWEGRQFYTGVAQDKNMMGMACLVFGLSALWRVLHELRGPRRVKLLAVHGSIVAMTLWLLWKCDSMTSLSCFVLAGGLMAAVTLVKTARKRAVVHLMVVAMLMVCFSALFLNFGGSVLKNMGRDSTLTGRTEIWGHLLKVPVNPIVGTGFESFWLAKRLDRLWAIPGMAGINEAHNGFLEVYLNLGCIGVALLSLIALTGYRNVINALYQDPEAGRLRLAYFFVGIAYSFTEAAFRMLSPVWIVFLFAMIAVPNLASKAKQSLGRKDAFRTPEPSTTTISALPQPTAVQLPTRMAALCT